MKKGVICGNFDVMHPGYIKMFKECAENCDCVVIVEERKEMLFELKSVCDVITYTYEGTLYGLLKEGEFDIRFLGDDYKNKPFTGDDLKIPIHYLDRSHGWSTTKFKKLIYDGVREQMG